ncbi:MAG: sulfite exporter TauE/SafE family protein [Negativicutes bacterium]|nr:sulfite exporter TauE/SafE family protein [Negativicutes bacterium]
MIELWAGLITLTATTVLTVAGVGAAFILIPIYLALGIELHTAMSTALLLNGISMVFASITFAKEKLILWRMALPIIIAATILSPLGAYASQYVPRNNLLFLFILFLLFAASMMLFYKPGKAKKEDGAGDESAKPTLKVGLPVGGFAGFVGGLLGVGGGNIVVPALIWLGIPPKQASATTSFIVIFSSFAGFAGRASLGSLDSILLLYTVVGSIGGALLGAWLMSKKMQNKHVKVVIGVLLYVIAAKMLFDLWR